MEKDLTYVRLDIPICASFKSDKELVEVQVQGHSPSLIHIFCLNENNKYLTAIEQLRYHLENGKMVYIFYDQHLLTINAVRYENKIKMTIAYRDDEESGKYTVFKIKFI